MYSKLAFGNVKKSIKDFTVYFLTLTFGVCLFYVFNSIGSQEAMLKINESQKSIIEMLQMAISSLSVFIAVILGFLVIYANRFLIKRRKKELGLYLCLGMDKRQVSKVLVIETLFIGVFALAAGLLAGVFLSQGLSAVTAKMFMVEMKEFTFVFSGEAFIKTIIYFAVIFLIVMIFNTFSISKVKVIDLLTASKKNETLKVKKLGVSVVLFLISVLCIGFAYHCIRENGMMEVDGQFWMSIIFGTIGTFLFFLSLSGFFLRVLKTNKRFYYRKLNMFVLRQINSKITTTFVSMTLLCLMLLVAIGVFSTGAGLATTMGGDMKKATPYDVSYIKYFPEDAKDSETQLNMKKEFESKGIDMDKFVEQSCTISARNYDKLKFKIFLNGRDKFVDYPKGVKKSMEKSSPDIISLSDYNNAMRKQGKQTIRLKSDEYAVNCNFENMQKLWRDVCKDGVKIKINGKSLTPKSTMIDSTYYSASAMPMDMGSLIVPDDAADKIPVRTLVYNCQLKGDVEKSTHKLSELLEKVYPNKTMDQRNKAPYHTAVYKVEMIEQSAGLSTVITYIAIYIGAVFLITCAAVLALQQLSENSDNVERYNLLRKIGADERMINHAMLAQIVIYFMVPLSLALVHSYIGVKVASNIIATLGNVNAFNGILASGGPILVIYGGYMLATYIGSKAVIKDKNR